MPTVSFAKSGNTVSLSQNDELLTLEFKKGNELPFGCKNAICGTCAMKVVIGIENLNPKNQDEEELLDALDMNDSNNRLGCQCIIQGDITIDPFNA